MVCRVFLCISCSYLFCPLLTVCFLPIFLEKSCSDNDHLWAGGGKQKEEEQQQKRTCFREDFRTSILIFDRSSRFSRVSSKFGVGSEML